MRVCSQCGRSYPEDTEFCSHDGTRLSTPAPVSPAPVTPTEAPTAAGAIDEQTLFRRYRILRPLGKGGMGSVFLAEQVGVGNRLCALKILQRNLLDDPHFVNRFHSEAASAGRIRHSNVVTIYESGQEMDGTPYIAMEYLEGESLGQRLRAHGPLPVPEAAEIVQQVARGLNAAHRLGIIHRDLKPDNIFLTQDDDGRLLAKVVDFGIAKLRESSVHTQTGGFLGTPAYMSFEQASGMRSDSLDARSDIYSLGIVAYEMLSGRLPFESDTILGFVRRHLTEDPAPLHERAPGLDVSPALEQVIMKALTKRRDDRQTSVLEFAREFATAAGVAPHATAVEAPQAANFDQPSRTGFGVPSADRPFAAPPSRYPNSAPGTGALASRNREAAVLTPPAGQVTPLPAPPYATPPAGRTPVPTPPSAHAAEVPPTAGYADQTSLDARAAEIQRAIERERLSHPSPEVRRYERLQRRMERLDRKLQGADTGSKWKKLRRNPVFIVISIAVILGILFSGRSKNERNHRSEDISPHAPSTPLGNVPHNSQPGGTADHTGGHPGEPEGPSQADKDQIQRNIEQGTEKAKAALRDALANSPAAAKIVKDLGIPLLPGALPPVPPENSGGFIPLPSGARVILQPLTPQALDHPVKEGALVAQQNVEGGLKLESADIAPEIVKRATPGSSVTLELIVDEDGSVAKGRYLSGSKSLAKPVISEAKGHWRFSAPRAGNVPVKASATVTVQF